MNDFLDTFTGSGTFVIPCAKNNITVIDNEYIFNGYIYKKAELDAAFGYKKRYENHQELINIPNCIGYIPVIAVKIYKNKSGKSLFIDFIDRFGTFTVLMNGKRKHGNEWIDVNFNFDVGKAYLLKCKSDPNWIDELKILDFRELKK